MKTSLFTIFCFIFSLETYSQNPSKSNEFQLGGQFYEEGIAAVNDINNNTYFLAASNSNISGNKTVAAFGGSDFWVVKRNMSNNLVWQKALGGSTADTPSGLILKNDYLFAFGYSYSGKSGSKTSQNIGQADFWVIKLDTMGNVLWDSTYGGSGEDLLIDAKQLNSGNILLGGTSNSNVSGTKTISSKGENDYYLIEINENGTILNEYVYGGSSFDNLTSLYSTENGGFILSGISFSPISGDKTEAEFGGGDIWILEIDKNGNIIMDKTIGGNNIERNATIYPYKNGFVICAGSFSEAGTGIKNSPNYGSNYDDIWVLRIDNNLNILWEMTLGGGLNDYGTDIDILDDETILIIGESSSSSNSGNKSQIGYGGSDLVICLLDSNGVILSDNYFGGSNDDFFPKLIKKNGSNNFSVVSTSLSSADGNKTTTGFGDADVWFFDLSIPVGIEDLNLTHQAFSVFPNPVQNSLNIKLENEDVGFETLKILDSSGKIVYASDQNIECLTSLDVSFLPKGTYILSMNSKTGEILSKLFIKHH